MFVSDADVGVCREPKEIVLNNSCDRRSFRPIHTKVVLARHGDGRRSRLAIHAVLNPAEDLLCGSVPCFGAEDSKRRFILEKPIGSQEPGACFGVCPKHLLAHELRS
jgi:hypothetical protein